MAVEMNITNYLSNAWEKTGVDEREFFNLLNYIDFYTDQITLDLKECFLYSVRNVADNVQAYSVNPTAVLPKGALEDRLLYDLPEYDTLSETIKEELGKDGLAMAEKSMPRNKMIVSSTAFSTLGQRIGIIANVMDKPSLARDCLIAEYIGRAKNCKAQVVVKNDEDGNRKAFAFLSSRYGHMPLATLETIIDELKTKGGLSDFEFISYKVNHRIVEARYAFPEYGEELSKKYDLPDIMVPGIVVMSSDTGECSARVKAYWETPTGSIVYGDEYSRMHKGGVDVEEILNGVRENVFDKYKEFPRRLQELSYIHVTPSDFDLKKPREMDKNGKMICNVFTLAINELGVPKIIGQSRMNELKSQLGFIVDQSQHYSAYAVAMDIMSLPDELACWLETSELGETGYKMLQKAVSKAPYLDYERIAAKARKQCEKMYMTPGV